VPEAPANAWISELLSVLCSETGLVDPFGCREPTPISNRSEMASTGSVL
jgi:hypothetical protein